MDTSSSDDSYQSDGEMRRKILKEPVPGNVDFYFLKTGKSKSEGVLITHSDNGEEVVHNELLEVSTPEVFNTVYCIDMC